MNQTPPHESQRYPEDDEISLIDLAKILIKRWKSMLLVFVLILGIAVAYALMQERAYTYTTIYSVAKEEATEPLESPGSVIAKIENLYISSVSRELIASENLDSAPTVSVSSPNETNIIRLQTQAGADSADLVERFHEQLLSRVVDDQEALVERRQRRLEQQLEGARQALETLEASSGSNNRDLVATYGERVFELEASLTDLTQGDVGQLAVQSLKPVGTSRSLILALGIVLGGMLAVMAAFFAEFAARVRQSLREDKA
ncbi:Wzz/FepE/Etk N-terminal domain-containing protein [Halomonas sp. NO4]|uniref:Wzz/FepE/Etk N-terminal domain-containing protein n=1 Tax=Halomonas sp. NO4 TaxID=2484813 RepID=UPI0013D3478A|nr:Wzz/FepE/Etk N-terminal domain-containing protein [Halomonas sp. NO4]